MFYDAHFTLDVTNWSRGIWVDARGGACRSVSSGTTLWMTSLMILLLSILVLLLRLLPGGGWRSRSRIQRDSTFYAKSMGEMTFVSGEVALTVDNVGDF